jgi:hypothetical protein
VRSAGQALATEAQSQHDRELLLMQMEQMLGAAPKPSTTPLADARDLYTCLLLHLLRPVNLPRLAQAGTIWVVVVILAFFLVDFSPLLFVLLLGVGLAPVQLYLSVEQARCGNGRDRRSLHRASQSEQSFTHHYGTTRNGGARERVSARCHIIRQERFYR